MQRIPAIGFRRWGFRRGPTNPTPLNYRPKAVYLPAAQVQFVRKGGCSRRAGGCEFQGKRQNLIAIVDAWNFGPLMRLGSQPRVVGSVE